MARVGAEHPYQATNFESAVRTSMPKSTSLQLTLSVTTKLAHLLQEQAGREIAINRIATAISQSLELGVILQKTVDEVGTALNTASCALCVEGPTSEQALTYSYFDGNTIETTSPAAGLLEQLDQHRTLFAERKEAIIQDCDDESEAGAAQFPAAMVPLMFSDRVMGALQVTSTNRTRVWQENEILLLRTVADQVAIAVQRADLFAQLQQQALTDPLTGCFNRRSFDMQLEKELMMSRRTHQPLSLVMLDLDRFKDLNDSAGHDAGDAALRQLGDCFRQELRGVDSAARFGGDEFALILPQADLDGALIAAERLRDRIAQINIPGFGNLTASIGIATFPVHAGSRAGLLHAADDALYAAKHGGRNRVCVAQNAILDHDAGRSTLTTGELSTTGDAIM
jgi:diguanylate cyclase (GGDEF)-like protein